MKVLVAVALFAFVALQVCQAAPRPDDEKKEDTTLPGAPPAPVAAEVKAEPVSPDAASKSEATVVPPEEKKE